MLKRLGDLKKGDIIFDNNGNKVEIEKVYDEHIPKKMFTVELENGEKEDFSGEHLWYIETNLDVELHNNRRRIGRKLNKIINSDIIDALKIYANSEENFETTLQEVLELLNIKKEQESINSIVRIAESIGPIIENSVFDKDEKTGELINLDFSYRLYNLNRFSQQILSLLGKRKDKKTWPLIIGKVVTTEEMLELLKDSSVYIPDSFN